METVLFYAKPSAINVKPYTYYTSASTIYKQDSVTVYGKSFLSLRNLYLSASDINAYNSLEYNTFNPFSAVPNLIQSNPSFLATVIPSFIQINDSIINFNIPQEILNYVSLQDSSYNLFIDVIIENEAGYALLSRDSYSYSVSSWSGFQPIQKPCINGILVKNTKA